MARNGRSRDVCLDADHELPGSGNPQVRLLEPGRPTGYAPRGSSLGFFGLMTLSGAVPLATMQSLLPVFKTAFDHWLDSIPFLFVCVTVFIIVCVLNLHKRRLWFIYLMFISGCLLLASYAIGVTLALLILVRIIPLQEPDLHFASYFNVFYWAVAGIFAWWTLRMIRLRYWQPWTTPEQWEPGDEAGPRWAQRLRERS